MIASRGDRSPTAVACGLALLPFLLAVAPSAGQEGPQVHRYNLAFPANNGGTNGYAHGRAALEYSFSECLDGRVYLYVAFDRESVVGSNGYWYEGNLYPITGAEYPSLQEFFIVGAVVADGRQIGSFNRPVSAGLHRGCFTGVDGYDLGRIADLVGQSASAEQRGRFMRSLRLAGASVRATAPLRNGQLEARIRQQVAASEAAARQQAAADARVREQAAQRQRAEAERAQAARAAQGTVPVRPTTATSADSAAEARRRAEADAERARQAEAARQRAAVEEVARQAEEQRRRAEETRRSVNEASTAVASAAQASGAYAGGYGWTMNSEYSYGTFEKLTGLGFGMNWRHVFMDGGWLSGSYTDEYVQAYSDDNQGLLELDKNLTGFYAAGGVILGTDFTDGLFGGLSLGGMMAGTVEASLYAATLGLVLQGESLKLRVDMIAGDEVAYGLGFYVNFGR